MFIYEKNGKLNMQFSSGQIPVNVPTLQITQKETRIGSTIIPEQGEIVSKPVVMGTEYFDTLQEAINACKDGDVISLLTNVKEGNVEIAEGKNVGIDLNGYKLENDGDCHTIINRGILTIIDSLGTGVIDNTIHRKSALLNEQTGVVEIHSGTLNRSKEAGTSSGSGGNSYYTILNKGTMKITSGVKVLQNNGTFSSLIDNGWYDGTQNTSKKPAVLIIEGGEFINGLNTLKNDDFGVMKITGGKFVNSGEGVVLLNWNKCDISGGEFIASNNTNAVIGNGYLDDESDIGVISITGGTFRANNKGNVLFTDGVDAKQGGSITVEGGNFYGNVVSGLPYEIIDNGNLLK